MFCIELMAKHDFDTDEADLIKGGYRRKFILYPPFWDEPANQITFPLTWKKYKFTRANLLKIDKQRGVYCFVIQPSVQHFFETRYLLYIGKTNRELYARYGEYLKEQEGLTKSRPKVKAMLDKYKSCLFYYFTPLKTEAMVNEVEDKLINTWMPQINVQIPLTRIKPEFKYIYE